MAEGIKAVEAIAPEQVESTQPRLRLVDDQPDLVFDVLDGAYVRIVKPVVDRVGAVVLLLAASPLRAAVAVAVRIKLGPGVVYKQRRVGRDRKVFMVYKFRSMDPDRRASQVPFSGVDRRETHKSDQDPRHSNFGRLLRKSSFDELPQLINVALGQMSLVGPRPELESVVERFDLWDHPRHLVRPGITGAWQISDLRDELLYKNMHIDQQYLDEVSLGTDIRILLSTIGAISSKSGN